MREIEIKVQLNDSNEAIKKLSAAGVELSSVKEQHDVVYCLPADKAKENDPNVNWLRIRTEDDRIFHAKAISVGESGQY